MTLRDITLDQTCWSSLKSRMKAWEGLSPGERAGGGSEGNEECLRHEGGECSCRGVCVGKDSSNCGGGMPGHTARRRGIQTSFSPLEWKSL